jgi:hypothetical protein
MDSKETSFVEIFKLIFIICYFPAKINFRIVVKIVYENIKITKVS